ncbi:MAG: dihydrofolate reductase [Candidatus Cryptobacteroides sp.]
MNKTIIAAIADNNAIGRDNALLWHISADLKFFKKTTSGFPVIMGRKTFESIGRPLPGRLNIVLTSSQAPLPEGVVRAGSLEEAFETAQRNSVEKCFVIGGGKVYAEAIRLADSLVLTRVHTTVPDADTFFPEIDPAVWAEDSRSETFSEEGLDFEFVTYRRI